jgi:ribosomal protein S8E
MTKMGPKRVHIVRGRGGNLKYRACRRARKRAHARAHTLARMRAHACAHTHSAFTLRARLSPP